MRRARSIRLLAVLMSALLAGCAVLAPLPEPASIERRLAMLPIKGLPLSRPVTIRWNDHQVPFIEAETDADLAFALGLVHAHLRLGQMEIMRRISQGRIAEMGGPLAVDFDRGLRAVGFGKAVPEMERNLPAETRMWLERYVAGVNHLLFALEDLPHEFRVLGLERERWTVRDLLGIVRLGSVDVNWLIWFNLLRMRGLPGWTEAWQRLVTHGTAGPVSIRNGETAGLKDILEGVSRSGSNSVVVAGSRTESGAAMIASDPHLGLNLPNVWLIAGMKSPSVHAVGLMFPGLPFVALGRNERIAWGGTNMRAAASDLYDVSKLPPSEIAERTETIKVRWWFDSEVTIRETKYGPIVSDAPALAHVGAPLALRWVGHMASDEITAMLKVNRARDFAEYRAAFETFAVPAQNMMYADAAGNIGQVLAVRLPIRGNGVPPDLVRDPADPTAEWRRLADPTDLPYAHNPERGFLASANNKPAETPYPIGYFFSPGDRVERMAALVGGDRKVSVADLEALQQDVYMQSAAALRDEILGAMATLGVAPATGEERALVERLRAWDGHYRRDSGGAVAFETLFHFLKDLLYEGTLDPEAARNFISVADIKLLLVEDVAAAMQNERPRLAHALREALAKAAPEAAKFAAWGEMHRLGLSHMLGNVPVVGERYRFGEWPAPGSTDTLWKTSHGSSAERHFTRYGSQARHISDLSDLDANFFLVLGGQDGWLNSSTFRDQVPMFLEGRYIQVPMRPETVRATFPHETVLSPAASPAS